MDCSPTGSSVHGILQARILEWVAISFSRGSSRPRDQTQVSHTAGRCLNLWPTREANIYVYVHLKPQILKEISPEYSLEGLMLNLKLQYFGYLMQKTDSLKKTLMLGKTKGGRRRGWQDETVGWHHRLDGHEFEQAPGVGDEHGSLVCCSPWGHRVRHYWATELNLLHFFNWLTKEKANKLGQGDSIRCSTEQIVFHFISLYNLNAILILN